MKAALIGNPNCGKTTLFNALTKSNLHVGNYPGITVVREMAKIAKTDIVLMDLPGTYSLNYLSDDEKEAVASCLSGADVIINVLDATSIARGLFLTKQLLEISTKMVVVLNMMDELARANGKIDINALEKELGVPVVAISAKKEKNFDKLIKQILCAPKATTKKLIGTPEEKAISFYKDIDLLCKKCVFLTNNKKRSLLDKILMGKITAIPCFVIIILFIIVLTFNVLGPVAAGAIEFFCNALKEKTVALLQNFGTSPFLLALVAEGVFDGVGSVLAFLPQVILLSFFLSVLEDTGYSARIAVVLDKPMRKFGFSGKSIVPIIMGLGCSVPAVLACRTLKNTKKQTAICVPLVSCPARLPVYFMLSAAFFKRPVLIILFLYLIGFVCAFVQGAFLKKESDEFLLELPPYRFPKITSVAKDMLSAAYDFSSRVFSVIFIGSIIVFLLSNLDFCLNYSPSNSIMAFFARLLLPAFKPIGICSWQVLASLFAGISAKEAILSSMNTLKVTSSFFNAPSAFSFLVFCALYCPCIATLAVIKKEFGFKTALLTALRQTVIAYALALVAFLILKNAFNFG